MPDPSEHVSRVTIAKHSPWAFMLAEAALVALAVVTWLRGGGIDWLAVAIAVALFPAVVVSWVCRELVRDLLHDVDALRREARLNR